MSINEVRPGARRAARPVTVVGDAVEVRDALQLAQDEGRLLAVTDPARLADGRVQVTAHYAQPRGRWEQARPWLAAAAVTAVVGTAAAVVYAAVVLVTLVIAWVAAHAAAIVTCALLGAVLLAVLGGRGGCPGLHCGGCGR